MQAMEHCIAKGNVTMGVTMTQLPHLKTEVEKPCSKLALQQVAHAARARLQQALWQTRSSSARRSHTRLPVHCTSSSPLPNPRFPHPLSHIKEDPTRRKANIMVFWSDRFG